MEEFFLHSNIKKDLRMEIIHFTANKVEKKQPRAQLKVETNNQLDTWTLFQISQ
jgi:hypothetical protein